MSEDAITDAGAPPLHLSGDGFFEFILENEPNLVFVKDEDSRLVFANRAFREVYAPDDRDSLLGTTTVEKFDPREAELFLEEDRRAMRRGRSEIVETIHDWKGERRTLLSRKFVYELPDGRRRLVAISTDITDLADREERVVRLNAQMKSYASTIAHDLRNPIASIIGGLNVIERDNPEMSERSRAVLEAVRNSATGLSEYIVSMLSAATQEAAALDRRACDLNLLLEEVRFNLSDAIGLADMDLHIARMPVIEGNPAMLRQLFQNLIENAIRHADPVDRLRVTIHHGENGGDHLFIVSDNGSGIAPDKLDRVFQQFFKRGSSEGLGLGLTICQRIAHLHEGYLEVDRSEATGCRIVLRLPKAG